MKARKRTRIILQFSYKRSGSSAVSPEENGLIYHLRAITGKLVSVIGKTVIFFERKVDFCFINLGGTTTTLVPYIGMRVVFLFLKIHFQTTNIELNSKLKRR